MGDLWARHLNPWMAARDPWASIIIQWATHGRRMGPHYKRLGGPWTTHGPELQLMGYLRATHARQYYKPMGGSI